MKYIILPVVQALNRYENLPNDNLDFLEIFQHHSITILI